VARRTERKNANKKAKTYKTCNFLFW
jgi:hypothetical protein